MQVCLGIIKLGWLNRLQEMENRSRHAIEVSCMRKRVPLVGLIIVCRTDVVIMSRGKDIM